MFYVRYTFLYNRLLENLIQREREYQTLLQQTLQQKVHDLQLLQLQLKTTGKWANEIFYSFKWSKQIIWSNTYLYLKPILEANVRTICLVNILWIVAEIQPSFLQHNVDEELIKWLKQQRADSDAIDRVRLNRQDVKCCRLLFSKHKLFLSVCSRGLYTQRCSKQYHKGGFATAQTPVRTVWHNFRNTAFQ